MRKLILCFTVAVLIAGCASEQEDASVSSSNAPSVAHTMPAWAMARPADRAAFASLPDRGALLAYDRARATLNRGAETYHPVQLSEAHALNASAPGRSIALQTPSGENLSFAYQRMEEGLDGNWSWIGRTGDGLEAIITFGEDAVFGRIEQRGTQALQITMSAGQPWLVQADRNRMFDGNLLRGDERSDVLIPSTLAVSTAARKQAAAVATATKAGDIDTKASAANTVDVVLGYTNGLVARIGSVSATNTRLTNLIAITNQAYQNSQVTPRVRLVRTVQVNYTDTNDNEVALEALTGVSCSTSGCSNQTVPAELQPLRDARDQYGGDLVSLVRQYKPLEQSGCGLSWLLGGGGFVIDNTDAPFGYSVVSDGTGVNQSDGRSYFCYDVTLAHELGHNMGQVHNVEDSGGDSGTHPYSYGYRETSTTGFFTVMAYEIDNASQFSITNFANPSVTYADTGRVTGTANANNAASLNISMPLVVQFRNLVVPMPGGARTDINGDGRSDIVWRNATAGLMDQWWQNGAAIIGTGARAVAPIYRVVGTGDFDGDGRGDLLWTNNTNDILWIWRSQGNGNFDVLTVGGYPPSWEVSGIADLNGDGRSDIVWRNPTLELMDVWFMNGAVPTAAGARSVGAIYRIVGTGDFDGDGRGDLLWTNNTNNILWIWRSQGNGNYDVLTVGSYPTGWEVSGVADINADGRADIAWRNPTLGLMDVWRMNGASIIGSSTKSVSSIYRIVATGDYDGDGRGDLLWTNNTNDILWIWRSQGDGNFEVLLVSGYPPTWTVVSGTSG